MPVLRRFLCSILMLLGSAVTAAAAQGSGAFYYLDYPEDVQHPGVLADMPLPPGQPARVFFHYCNRTHQPQEFWCRTTGALWNVRWGSAADFVPGHAGSQAATNFLACPTYGDKRDVTITSVLPPGAVISGIFEGIPDGPVRVLCRMGDGPPILTARVQISHHISWDVTVPLDDQRRFVKVRIGDHLAGHIDGDYGATFRIYATVPRRARVQVSVSPRGGDIRFVYRHNGVVYKVVGCQAEGAYLLYTALVSSGDTLEMMPVGGYCYPVEISYHVLAMDPPPQRYPRYPLVSRHRRASSLQHANRRAGDLQ